MASYPHCWSPLQRQQPGVLGNRLPSPWEWWNHPPFWEHKVVFRVRVLRSRPAQQREQRARGRRSCTARLCHHGGRLPSLAPGKGLELQGGWVQGDCRGVKSPSPSEMAHGRAPLRQGKPLRGAGRCPPASGDSAAGQAEPSRVDGQSQREFRRCVITALSLAALHTQHRLRSSLKRLNVPGTHTPAGRFQMVMSK